MRAFTQAQSRRLIALHGWSGTILGLLLYAVIVTGTVAVFGHEIGTWSASGKAASPWARGVDAQVRMAGETMSKGYQQRILVSANGRGELMVFPYAAVRNPDTGERDAYGALFVFDPEAGALSERHDGYVFQRAEWYEVSALEVFLEELHVRLYTPEPWGLLLTGVLGLATMILILTGILIHRHIIRDMFVAPRPGGRVVSLRDLHSIAATWALPFAFVLALTGSFYSFAKTITYPVLTEIAFAGDSARMAETLFEAPVKPDNSPAPLADLDKVVADSLDRAAAPIYVVEIYGFGRADARIRVYHAPAAGGMVEIQNIYDGATGRFIASRGPFGNVPSSGGDLLGLMGPLHFGNFAGTVSKVVWVALGVAMAFVVISGLRLWVRRREDENLWWRFGRAVTVAGYGIPLAIEGAAHAYFVAAPAGGDTFWWAPAGFVIGAMLAILLGVATRREDVARRCYRLVLGGGALSLPIVRMATGGLDWAHALSAFQGEVLGIDMALIAIGGVILWWSRRVGRERGPSPDANS